MSDDSADDKKKIEQLDRFLTVQSEQISLEKQQVDIQRQEIEANQQQVKLDYELSKESIRLHAKDRAEERTSSDKRFKAKVLCGVGVGLALILSFFGLVFLGEGEFAKEMAKVLLSAGLGYFVGRNRRVHHTHSQGDE